MNERFSDEMLMRFADGELDAEEMELVEKAMEADDELVSRVAMFIETKAQAQAALKPLLDEPVPEALQASVAAMVAEKKAKDKDTKGDGASAGAAVLPFEPRQKSARPAPRRWTLPLAASIAAVAGGLAGYWAAGGAGPGSADGAVSVAGRVGAELGEALASVPASQEIALADGTRFRAIASFRNDLAELCREFELDGADRSTSVSVACHSGGAWAVSFMVAAAGGTDGYAPASSTEALDAYLSAIEASEPLSPEDEAAALIAARGD